jgi:zinc protease
MVSYALELFRGALFSEHPYRFSTMGSEESVNSLTRNQLVDLYRAIVKPGGMVISVTGDIEVGDAYRLVEKYFGDIEGMSFDPGPMPVEFDKEGVTETRLTRDDKSQTHIILGYPGPDLKSPDLDTLKVMNAVLTGQGGRLFTELRDRMSLAYSVFSFVAPGLDPGYFAFGIGVSPERESEAIDAFLEQIKMLREEAVSQEELARAKMYLIGRHTIGLQTVNSRADEVFFPVLYGQDLEEALLYSRRINAVTVEQIQEAARKYFDLENYTVAIIEGSTEASQKP